MAGTKRRMSRAGAGEKPRMGRPVLRLSKLGEWIEAHGWSRQRLADELGIVRGSVDRLCSGLRRPSLELALKIEALTEGAVPVSYWAEIPAHARD